MRTQLLESRILGVDAILFTHSHADHITGIDDVRILNRIADRPLTAYATQQSLDELNRRFGYAFKPWTPPGFYRPVLIGEVVSPYQTIEAAGMTVALFNQNHGRVRDSAPASVSAVFRLLDRCGAPGAEAAFAVLEGVDTWVVGCFLRNGTHPTHADLTTVLSWVDRLKPRRTVFTHMGTDMDWAWMQANLPPGVEPGHDGMTLTVA